NASGFVFTFDPVVTADNRQAGVHVMTPSPTPREATGPLPLIAQGNGVDPTTIYANFAGFDQALALLVNDASPVTIQVAYNSSLLQPAIPQTTFQISLPTEPGRNITGNLLLGDSASLVQSALWGLDSIGVNGVTVTLARQKSPGP